MTHEPAIGSPSAARALRFFGVPSRSGGGARSAASARRVALESFGH
jgi:hypothetical protein